MNKILIVKLGSIGDVVHALPLLPILKKHYPQAHISWIIEEKSKEIIRGNPFVDQIIIIDTKRWRKSFGNFISAQETIEEILSLFHKLKKDRYDLAIDVQGLIKSGLIAFFSRAKLRLGFNRKNCREKANSFFTHKQTPPLPLQTHIIDKNLSLLKLIGIDPEKEEKKIDLDFLTAEFEANVDLHLRQNNIERDEKIIGINPGGGWKTKLWGEDNYAQLADRLADYFKGKIKFLIFWGPGEKEMAAGISRKMKNKAVIIQETGLKGLIAYLKRCSLIIGGESGPLHMANALGVPTVILFGPSSPDKNRPYFTQHSRNVIGKCRHLGCYKRECENFICMSSIEVEAVAQTTLSLIRERF